MPAKRTRICPAFLSYLGTDGWALQVQGQRGQPHPCSQTRAPELPQGEVPPDTLSPDIWPQEVAAEPLADVAQLRSAARNSADWWGMVIGEACQNGGSRVVQTGI